MDLIVEPTASLSGKIDLPLSKLYTQIACALAILAGGKSTIESPLRVKDTNVMLKAADLLGATTKRTKEKWSIWGLDGELKPAQNVIDAKNSGTALSLLTSIAALSQTPTVVNGDAQLRSRRMFSLLEGLRRLGADVHSTKPDDSPPFVVFGGGFKGGKVRLSEVGAHDLPAVLLPTPYAEKKVEVAFPSSIKPFQLEPITGMMKLARADAMERRNRVLISGRHYRAFNYKTQRELANAAPFIAAAGLTDSELKFHGAKGVSGRDVVFVDALKSFGLRPHIKGKSVRIGGGRKLRGTRLSLSSAPELLPIMAVIACRARGKTLIRDAGGARAMKSDRISAISQELRRMRAKVLERSDGLLVQGPSKLKGCEVDSHNDYAVGAALAVAALVADGKTTIKNGAEALRTSYTRFVTTFQSLGANISYAH